MVFAHDTEVSLYSAAALVNTEQRAADELADTAALDAFCAEHAFTGSRTHDEAELLAVRAVRPRLRALWADDRDGVVATVNALLAEHHALPQLVRHDRWDWHVHATPASAPLAARMAVEAAMAVAEVIRLNELDRLRGCAAEDCDDVVVDLSRNRSRRYCDHGCGNRVNVAAFRARRSAQPQA